MKKPHRSLHTIMKGPTSPEELKTLHDILHYDPQRYLGIVNEWIRQNPKNSGCSQGQRYIDSAGSD
jgi:hypothetical protein